MDEEKNLSSTDEIDVNDSDDSSSEDTPVDEQNANENGTDGENNDSKVGNGYKGLASSNREAYARGLNENYSDRIARNQAALNEARERAANPNKMKKGHEDEEMQTDEETGESNFKEKNILDKAKDKLDVLGNKTELASSKIDEVRSKTFKVMHPGEAAKMALKAKIKAMLIPALIPICFGLMFVFVTFVVVLLVTGLFETNDSSSGIAGSSGGECGFTISSTSLTKNEYKEKICEYANKKSKANVFCTNANTIYDLSRASNINPELVIVRADVEGYSPGASRNNYWGIGCYNGAGVSACKSYSSFNEGVKAFIKNISQYDSLIDMMKKYAYIGKKWNKGSSSSGGCYYFEYMKDYYASSAEAQKSKANAAAACAAGGTGIATTEHDQDAYASYQVNKNMASARERIFGLTDKNSLDCPSTNIQGDGNTTGTMTHPCPGLTRVSSEYGPRKSPGGIGSTNHKGIDLAAPTGTPVYAVDGGTVILSKYSSSAGNYIAIQHDGGIITQYMHLSARSVSVGDKVTKNQLIGKVGNTGNSTGPHLHFGIITSGGLSNPKYVNPRKYINF